MNRLASHRQLEVFRRLKDCGELILACGPRGCVANLVGTFQVRKNHKGEDQLEMGDGTHHVHIDWSRIKSLEVAEFHGEEMITFFDGGEPIFRLYSTEGPFQSCIKEMAGKLIE